MWKSVEHVKEMNGSQQDNSPAPFSKGKVRHRVTVQVKPSFLWLVEPSQEVGDCCFARAAPTHYCSNAALRKLQDDLVQHLDSRPDRAERK